MDESYQNAKRDFKSASNSFNQLKTDEARTRARYNKIKKEAKKKFKIKRGQRINNLAKKQRREFWKNINATDQKTNENANSLTIEDLHDYFKSIFGETPAYHHFDENALNQMQSNEDLDSTEFYGKWIAQGYFFL